MSHSPRIDTLMSWLLEFCKGRQKLRPSSYPSPLSFYLGHAAVVLALFPPEYRYVYCTYRTKLYTCISSLDFEIVGWKKDIKIRWIERKERIRELLAMSKVDGFPRIFTDKEGRGTLCQLVRENCRRWKLWTTVVSRFKNSAINKMCKQVALLWCRWWRV